MKQMRQALHILIHHQDDRQLGETQYRALYVDYVTLYNQNQDLRHQLEVQQRIVQQQQAQLVMRVALPPQLESMAELHNENSVNPRMIQVCR